MISFCGFTGQLPLGVSQAVADVCYRLWEHLVFFSPVCSDWACLIGKLQLVGICPLHVAAWASSQTRKSDFYPEAGFLHSKSVKGQGVQVTSLLKPRP